MPPRCHRTVWFRAPAVFRPCCGDGALEYAAARAAERDGAEHLNELRSLGASNMPASQTTDDMEKRDPLVPGYRRRGSLYAREAFLSPAVPFPVPVICTRGDTPSAAVRACATPLVHALFPRLGQRRARGARRAYAWPRWRKLAGISRGQKRRSANNNGRCPYSPRRCP